MDSILLTYGLPIAALIFGAVVSLVALWSAREFDRKYSPKNGEKPLPTEASFTRKMMQENVLSTELISSLSVKPSHVENYWSQVGLPVRPLFATLQKPNRKKNATVVRKAGSSAFKA